MRLYVSILAAAGLSMSACGKKADPQPSKTEQPAQPTPGEDPKKAPTAEAPKDPTAEAPKDPTAEAPRDPTAEAPKDPTPVVAVDRTERAQKALAAWAAGDLEAAYADYADDVVYYNVGNPQMPEVKGKAALIEMGKAMKGTLTDTQARASRIIEAGALQVIEYVVSAKFAPPGEAADAAKPFSVPAALVLAYNADGKVATAWKFQDDASVLMQVGVVPGLPEDFKAAALPDGTEVVKGEANEALAAVYKDFGMKIMSAETIGAAVELLHEDFTMVDFRTGKTIVKADMAETMKGWLGMFGDATSTTEKDFSVGDFYVAVSSMTGTFKGGGAEAEAGDHKVSLTSLHVARIVDGKLKSWTSYSNGMQLMPQLAGAAAKPESGGEAKGDAKAVGGDVGVAACDRYLELVRGCMAKLPEAASTQFEAGIQSALDAWKKMAAEGDATRSALETACRQALETSRQTMASLCPDVKWE